jgi:hypothetical protein
MALLEEKIYTVLSSAANVTAITGLRIYPVIRPQDSALPAITYTRISGGQISSLTSYSHLESPRIQIDVWTDTYGAGKALAIYVRNAMLAATTFQAIIESDNDSWEEDPEMYRVSMDFFVWHND